MDGGFFTALVGNASLLIALCLLCDIAAAGYGGRGKGGPGVSGLFPALAVVAAAALPARFSEGFSLDSSTVLLSLATFFYAPFELTGIALAALATRLVLGANVAAGAVSILSALLVGYSWKRLRGLRPGGRGFAELYLLGLAAQGTALLCLFLFPGKLSVQETWKVGMHALLVLPFATMVLGGLLQDRRRHLKAEQQLAGERDRFLAFAEAYPYPMYVKDLRSNIVMANGACSTLFDVPQDKLQGMSTAELHKGNAYVATYLEQDRKVIETGGEVSIETKVYGMDGLPHDTLIIEFPIRDASGRVAYIGGINIDVSVERGALEQLRIKREHMEASLKAARMGIFSYDIESKTGEMDQQYAELLGIDYSSFTSTIEEFYASIHPDDRAKILEALGRTKELQVPYSCDYRSIWRDGSVHYISTRGELYYDDSGNPTKLLGVSWDETERVLSEVEKGQLKEQLHQAQKMEALGTLAGGIAHDFNNILGAILGYTELSLGIVSRESELNEYLTEVRGASLRARDLVKEILSFSRKSSDTPKPLHLEPIIKEVIKLLRSIVPKTIEINWDAPLKPVSTALATPTQIHQIAMNLGTNAFHALSAKGGHIWFTLGMEEVSGSKAAKLELTPGVYLKLTVRDDGPGISQENIGRIFDPFFTTKALGEGTGLGLSVVHGIAKGNGGCVEVESETGQGACFTVYLPEALEEGAEAESPKPKGDGSLAGSAIVVDDEAPIAKLIARVLASRGMTTVYFTSPQKALKHIEENGAGWNLLVTDQTMPFMTGSEFFVELKNRGISIPSILCTGHSDLIDEAGALQLGFLSYIKKPVEQGEFVETVRKTLLMAEAAKDAKH